MSKDIALIDALAAEIRRVDGSHSLGAGALAEALAPFVAALLPSAADEPDAINELWDALSVAFRHVSRTSHCKDWQLVNDVLLKYFDRPASARPSAGADAFALLRELIDIEGPQPGTAAWADKVRALLASPVAPAAEGWQPIASAPKSMADGNRVGGIYLLGFNPLADVADDQACVDVIWWEPLLPNKAGTRGKWCASSFGHAVEVSPTHWQPLPAAPSTAQPEAT